MKSCAINNGVYLKNRLIHNICNRLKSTNFDLMYMTPILLIEDGDIVTIFLAKLILSKIKKDEKRFILMIRDIASVRNMRHKYLNKKYNPIVKNPINSFRFIKNMIEYALINGLHGWWSNTKCDGKISSIDYQKRVKYFHDFENRRRRQKNHPDNLKFIQQTLITNTKIIPLNKEELEEFSLAESFYSFSDIKFSSNYDQHIEKHGFAFEGDYEQAAKRFVYKVIKNPRGYIFYGDRTCANLQGRVYRVSDIGRVAVFVITTKDIVILTFYSLTEDLDLIMGYKNKVL